MNLMLFIVTHFIDDLNIVHFDFSVLQERFLGRNSLKTEIGPMLLCTKV